MVKEKYNIKSSIGKALIISNGQKYILPGWIPVSDLVTLDDIEITNPLRHIKSKRFTVKGSKNVLYTVELLGLRWKCDCIGYKYHGKCKHIAKIKENV